MLMPLSQAQRARFATRATWLSVVGLLLVPLVVGGLLTWALWDPQTRLDRVSAAIVNEDEPVTLNGQMVPLGRQLAAALVTGQGTGQDAAGADSSGTDAVPNVSGSGVTTTFDWVLSDASDATDGLGSGRYDVVLTIPSDFSAKATSYTGDASAASRATFDVTTSTRARPMDGAIAQALATTAADVLGTELTKGYISQVLVSFGTLHDSLGQAADGASKLADGATGLTDGSAQLATGTTALADGVSQVAGGASDLSSGLGQLADGANALADGVGQVSGGANDLAGGLDTFAAQVAASASAADAGVPQVQQLASGLAAVSGAVGGTGGLADSAGQLASGAGQLSTGISTLLGNLETLAGACQAGTPLPGVPDPCGTLVATIHAQRTETVVGGQPTVTASATQLAGGLTSLHDGMTQPTPLPGGGQQPSLVDSLGLMAAQGGALVSGAQQSAAGLHTLAGYLGQTAAGARQLAGGAGQAASGADQLSIGASDAAYGAGQLADGADQAAAGAGDLASGADQVADGASQLAGGASDLADGLGQAVDQIPTYTDEQATSLADVIASPVEATETSVPLGTAAVPVLMALALWLGAMATYLVLTPLGRQSMGSPRSSLQLAWQSFWPAAGIGVGQALVLTVVMGVPLGLSVTQWVQFGGLAVLAAVALTAVNQGLAALLGGVGRFVAVVVAAVTLATGVISTAPGLLTGLAALLPTAPLVSGLRAAVQAESGLGSAAVLLAVWGLAGLSAATAAIARTRVVDVGALARS